MDCCSGNFTSFRLHFFFFVVAIAAACGTSSLHIMEEAFLENRANINHVTLFVVVVNLSIS